MVAGGIVLLGAIVAGSNFALSERSTAYQHPPVPRAAIVSPTAGAPVKGQRLRLNPGQSRGKRIGVIPA